MAENYFGLTDTGKVRDNNEDTFIAQTVMNNRYILACVIDGVGGYNGGEVAAAIAQEEILKQFDTAHDDLEAVMIKAFQQASNAIYNRKQQNKDLQSMACVSTMALVDLEKNQFHYVHVGDTRLYLLRDESLVKISKDHSFVGFLEDSGRLTESAAMGHPKRNEINKALGFNAEMEADESYIEAGQSPFLPGDMILLCSDGLSDMVDKSEITAIITAKSSLATKAQYLIDAANNNGGNDNITVVLVANNKTPNRPAATMPATAPAKKNETAKPETVKSIPAPEREPEEINPAPVVKRSWGLTLLLGFLCLVFLAGTIWCFNQWQGALAKPNQQPAAAIPKRVRNPQEIKLQNLINNAKGQILLLSDTLFSGPVIIGDTILVDRDSLLIKAKGNIVFQSDSGYAGPALILSPRCKITVLDSLQFQGFKTALVVHNTALVLKNVRFSKGMQAVQNIYGLPIKKYINTTLQPLAYQAADSVAKVIPHPKNGVR